METLIEVKNIGKYFGPIKAVDGISFEVKRGEVLGFLGPNGAGKTTTMRLLTCFLSPSFGTATVCGHDIGSDSMAVRSKIGYLPENAPAYEEMRVCDFLRFIAEIRGFSEKEAKNRISSIIDTVSLKGVLYQTIDTLSKGYKRRVGLAQALLHDPEILILDEPTDGLDPNQKYEVRELIKDISPNKSIIVSTHILEEVDAVCSRMIIIDKGKIVVDDSPSGLRGQSATHGVVRLGIGSSENKNEKAVLEAIPLVERIEESVSEGIKKFTIYPVKGKDIVHSIAKAAHEKGWEVREFSVDSGKLEDVFREITTGKTFIKK